MILYVADLEYLVARYGGAEAYLIGGGMRSDDLESLRVRLLDTAPGRGHSYHQGHPSLDGH